MKYEFNNVMLAHRWEHDGRVSGAPAIVEIHAMHAGLHQGQSVVDVEERGGQRVARPGQALDRKRVGLLHPELEVVQVRPPQPGTQPSVDQIDLIGSGSGRTGMVNRQ